MEYQEIVKATEILEKAEAYVFDNQMHFARNEGTLRLALKANELSEKVGKSENEILDWVVINTERFNNLSYLEIVEAFLTFADRCGFVIFD